VVQLVAVAELAASEVEELALPAVGGLALPAVEVLVLVEVAELVEPGAGESAAVEVAGLDVPPVEGLAGVVELVAPAVVALVSVEALASPQAVAAVAGLAEVSDEVGVEWGEPRAGLAWFEVDLALLPAGRAWTAGSGGGCLVPQVLCRAGQGGPQVGRDGLASCLGLDGRYQVGPRWAGERRRPQDGPC